LNLSDLEKKLRVYSANKDDKRVKIGSFCAASNVTGIINDIDKICMMYEFFIS
jgi:selenocysteine lyase/cysteine desulfurase